MSKEALSTKNLTKQFSGVLAVNGVDFSLKQGEIHGLVGENGAGKSTFVKLINGSLSPTSGEIFINGIRKSFKSPQHATLEGVGMVYQELMLLPHLSIAENICLPLYLKEKRTKISWKEINKIAKEKLESLGFNFDVTQKIGSVSVAIQQIVAICRALIADCNILILDEPTSSLSDKDAEILLKTLNKLKKQGYAIIFISHRLEEVLEISDRITVLRNGNKVATFTVDKSITVDTIAEYIVGKKIEDKFPKRIKKQQTDEIILEVEDLSIDDIVNSVSFQLKKGEILGIVGTVGAGKTEIAKALFGAQIVKSGKILFNKREINISSPFEAIKNRIALVPENRRDEGLILNKSIKFNISLPILRTLNKFGFIEKRKEKAKAKKFVDSLNIKCTSIEQIVEFLSGGNQQKVVLAKWLAANMELVIFDEPTRGVDVGAKTEIYKLINEIADRNVGILLFTSEVPEVLGVADRVLILRMGSIIKEFNRNELQKEEVQRLVSSGR